jgi:hypothetical protein
VPSSIPGCGVLLGVLAGKERIGVGNGGEDPPVILARPRARLSNTEAKVLCILKAGLLSGVYDLEGGA